MSETNFPAKKGEGLKMCASSSSFVILGTSPMPSGVGCTAVSVDVSAWTSWPDGAAHPQPQAHPTPCAMTWCMRFFVTRISPNSRAKVYRVQSYTVVLHRGKRGHGRADDCWNATALAMRWNMMDMA